jgi:uncharacterized membrane protein
VAAQFMPFADHRLRNVIGSVAKIFLGAINERIKQIGTKPLCNFREDRAPHIMGICLPFCWRCTGIIAGSIAFFAFLHEFRIFSNSYLATVMLFPIAVDGIRQYGFKIESNNSVRFITGFLAGLSTGIIKLA